MYHRGIVEMHMYVSRAEFCCTKSLIFRKSLVNYVVLSNFSISTYDNIRANWCNFAAKLKAELVNNLQKRKAARS